MSGGRVYNQGFSADPSHHSTKLRLAHDFCFMLFTFYMSLYDMHAVPLNKSPIISQEYLNNMQNRKSCVMRVSYWEKRNTNIVEDFTAAQDELRSHLEPQSPAGTA